MKKILFFTAGIICVYFSCTKESGDSPPPIVQIHYVDSLGNDLFSTANDGQNGYWMDSVRIYDYANGIETLVYYPSTSAVIRDNPYGYSFSYYNGFGELMVIGANQDVVNRYSNSIIQLKTGVYDTLKTHIDGSTLSNSTYYDSIWYNSKLQVPVQGIITIVK